MTRETKLGIGVAGTFLTVVGAWAGVKMWRGEAPTRSDETPPAVEAKAETPAPAAAATETPAPVAVQPSATMPDPAPTPSPTDTTATTSAPPPALPVPVVTAPMEAAGAPATAPPNGDVPPPPTMPLPVMPAPVVETPSPSPDNANVPPPAVVAPVMTPPIENANPAPAVLPAPATESPPAQPKDQPAPAPAHDVSAPGPVPPPVVETRKDVEPPPSATIITKPADQPPPSVTVSPAAGSSPASLGPPGGGASVKIMTETAAPRPPSEPRVQSYLEEQYHWQPGDSFAAVSQKYYFSEKYAAALQQYNRDYPLAASGMRQDPPSMVPGQVIWVPPVRILERDHAKLIPDLKRLNDRGAPATPTVRPADSAGASSGFGSPRLYKVHERGETMYEIARRTLNDSGLWYLVHRLNPTLSRDPKLPIPAGTVLRLPPEAKVEPGDMP